MKNNLNYSNMKLLVHGFLEKNNREIPNLPAVIGDHDTLSHAELHNLVFNTVSNLEKIGFYPGINVALRFRDPIKHFVYFLALLKMGISQISINPNDTLKLQKKAILSIDIEAVIQDIPLDSILLPQTLYISEIWDSPILSSRWNRLKPNVDSTIVEVPALIIIGSGTTGEPKIFGLHATTMSHRFKIKVTPGTFERGEKYYCYTELHYIFPKYQFIRVLLSGLTIILPDRKPKCIISFCVKQKIDHMVLTGSQAIILLGQAQSLAKLSSLRLPELKSLLLTSSLITEPVRQRILTHITNKLFILYATNEFGAISMASPDDIRQHPGTVGQPFPEIELNIVDDNGVPCPRGEIGNILIKSKDKTTSYLNNPEATKKTFREEGFYPGDMGKFTKDGNLIFEGRKDDMIIYTGVNIYPRELESVLEAHPNVIESAVFPLYNKLQEGAPFAVVSVKSPTRESELLKWCVSELGWRSPKRILFVKKLPRNKAGKVLKKELAKQVRNYLTNLNR